MTASDDLHPSSGDPTPPPAAAENVALLPPPKLPPQPSEADSHASLSTRLLDRLLMVGVLALAFLLASLPARNSDVWLHLASGRLLAQGQYHFGVDPFAFTTIGVRWINPSWLYDLMSFLLFQWGGGSALVIGKAVLMALLAWTLLRLCGASADRQKSVRSWLAVLFAVLALLVVGSWMPLRPVCVSYLFLALTLWLLETRLAADRPRSFAAWWPMLLLFALWANLDAWFLLGPLTVALYDLGTELRLLLTGRERTRRLGLLFLAGLAACLLNPYHYRVFALPPLSFLADAKPLRDDPIFSRLFLSPFQSDYLHFRDIPDLGRLLYYVLALLGVVSFLLNGIARSSSACLHRLPTWLAFFALSAVDASTIPFFAIVAAPVTALNFRDYARRREAARSGTSRSRSPLRRIGVIVTLAIVLILPIAAWPGWLQGQLRQPRGWSVETDSSLVDAVQQAARWRREGRIRDGENGFNFSPTAAHYASWFAPEEKGFCDSRWRLCASVATDYVNVRRALLGAAPGDNAYRDILREHRVAYVVLHDSDVQRTAAVFQRLVKNPEEWSILFLKGDTLVFGWRDPAQRERADRFADWRLDFHRRAFQPPEEERAPAQGAGLEPNASGWRSFWTTASTASSHARDEAALYLIYFDTLRPLFLMRQRAVWEHSLAAALVGAAPALSALPRQFLDFSALTVSRAGPRPCADGGIWPLDTLAMRLAENYAMQQDEGPPSLLLLAVRAARRAIHEDPNDAQAHQILGEAYLHLMHNSRERVWRNDLPSLAHIRRIQAACAFHQSLLLHPDRIQPHTDLYVLYRDMDLLDLALHHARQVLHLMQTRGEFTGESQETWSQRLRRMEEVVRRLDEEVQRRLNKYELEAARRSVLEQAVLAQEYGLGRKALDILLASDVAVFGPRGTEMELDLLLTSGRIRDARRWMAPDQGIDLSSDSYHRFRILVAAADGDYRTCEEELTEMAASLDRPITMVYDAWKVGPLVRAQRELHAEKSGTAVQVSARQAVALKAAQLLLDMPLQRQTISWLLTTQIEKAQFQESIQTMAGNFRQRAEVDVLRGALALESGDVSQIEPLLRRALSVWHSETDAALGGGLDFGGRRTAQGMLDWLYRENAVP